MKSLINWDRTIFDGKSAEKNIKRRIQIQLYGWT